MPFDVLACRTTLGLSQMELAQRLAVHERTVRRWENGFMRGGMFVQSPPRKGCIQQMQALLQLKALGPLPAVDRPRVSQLGMIPSHFRV